MRKSLLLIAIALWLLPHVASARAWTPETLPMVHLQDARRYVCNPDGVLSASVVDSIDARLQALERDKGIETVVVVVHHLQGDDPYEFGMALGRKYGIGNKQHTGLIIILATRDRSYQILTGRGLEGTLPDAICRRVQNQVMLPALKRGDWDTALQATVESLDRYIRGDATLTAQPSDDDEVLWPIVVVMVIIIGITLVATWTVAHRSHYRCPRCGRRNWTMARRRRTKQPDGSFRIYTTWRCTRCGMEEVDETHEPPRPTGAARGASLPPIIGSMGHGGSAGTWGGSFGGGSFGGGGSGGRF